MEKLFVIDHDSAQQLPTFAEGGLSGYAVAWANTPSVAAIAIALTGPGSTVSNLTSGSSGN